MPHDVFVQLYERPRIPVVITGLQEGWKAQELWNQTHLDKRFANHKFKVRLDDSAAILSSMHLHDARSYTNNSNDDSQVFQLIVCLPGVPEP